MKTEITPMLTTNEVDKMQAAIDSFAVFQFNFKPNFIQVAFTHTGYLANHLQSKFNGIYEKYGAKSAIIMFYMELDTENRKILSNYIINTYAS